MHLSTLPRIRLTSLPTPLEEAPRLSRALGGPRIFFKRDDLTSFALGGNKVRKLEYLLADVLRQDADVIVTGAGPQSNYLRTTVAAARKLGLDAVLVMHGDPPAEVQGNYLLDRLAGAEIIFTYDEDRSTVDQALDGVADDLRRAGRRPYVIPRGGASPLGSVGYVTCALELETQLIDRGVQADHLVLATGACGTQAGLWLGACWLRASYRIWGISVSRPREECVERVRNLATAAAGLLEISPPPSHETPIVLEEYLGAGYGIITPEAVEAIRLVARTEGVFLDPVYTGKAMAGLMDLIRQGEFSQDDTVVFLHTGGTPGIFAHASDLQ
ncbi:MAG: D-cysteine desulfhydrase family protein [Chloroflexi bacterium]|nr:MAG: D-cysteine desulfhydrase family protein [Chloroflexota bacterium]